MAERQRRLPVRSRSFIVIASAIRRSWLLRAASANVTHFVKLHINHLREKTSPQSELSGQKLLNS
jgi:hypothetical protein